MKNFYRIVAKTSSKNKSPTNWLKESKMQMPDVPNVAVDSNGKVKVTVWAYRKLTEDELRLQVITFLRQKKIKAGFEYDVWTTIGAIE